MGIDLWSLIDPLVTTVMAKLPAILTALVVLFAGWAIARGLGRLVEKLVARITGSATAGRFVNAKDVYRLELAVGRVTYYLVMVFVLVLVFDILGLFGLMGPFQTMANEVTLVFPNLLKAGLILLGAWLLALVLRSVAARVLANRLVGRALDRIGVTEGEDSRQQVVETGGKLVYYLILLLFLPAVFGALQLEGLSGPLEVMLTQIVGFLPKLMAAAITAAIGYLVARVLQGILTHFLAAAGADSLPAKVGLGQVFEKTPLSRAIGAVAFVLVLIPVAISALEALGVEAISRPAVGMLTVVLAMIPNVAVALLILGVGLVIARWAGDLTGTLVESTNVSRLLVRWGLLKDEEGQPSVSTIVGRVVSGLIMLLVLVEVFEIVRLAAFSGMLRSLLAYLPNVVVAVVIMAAGWGVGQFAQRSLAGLLDAGRYPSWLGLLARVAIVTLAAMMALEQLGVARSIVVNAFTILLGSAGLAAALAVGFGARGAVRRWVDREME